MVINSKLHNQSEHSMVLLIDMGALKTGGGATLGLNFIKAIQDNKLLKPDQFLLLAPDKGPIKKYLDELPVDHGIDYLIQPGSYLKRLAFEYLSLRKHLKRKRISVSFTFFGVGIPFKKGIISIVTVANPTTCYDDSPYWYYLKWDHYVIARLVAVMRRFRTKRNHYFMVETEVMQRRLAAQFSLSLDKIRVKPPAPSLFVAPAECLTESNKILFLCTPYTHKNLWRLPSVASSLKGQSNKPFKFVLSCSEEEFLHSLDLVKNTSGIASEFNRVHEYFEFIGTVSPRNLQNLYESVFLVALISDLESFSNNYMEAWVVGRPLLVSERDFARTICDDSAYYCEPHEPWGVANAILELHSNKDLQCQLVEKGRARLGVMQNTADRSREILEYISSVSQDQSKHNNSVI